MDKVKKALKNTFNIKVFLIVAIIIICIIIISACGMYILDLATGNYDKGNTANVPYMASLQTDKPSFSEEGFRFEYKDKTGLTSQEMTQMIWDELINSDSNIEKYLKNVDELRPLVEAEIITQYPKLDNLPEGELNGIIEFERQFSDGTKEKLKYVNLETFKQKLEKAKEEENDEDRDEIVKIFTIDEEGKMLVAVNIEKTEELTLDDSNMDISDYSQTIKETDKQSQGKYYKKWYDVQEKQLDYKKAVSKYTMPFEYIWAFIVIGDDVDVGLEMAQLVQNSEITITIFDNIETRTDDNTIEYDKQKKANITATATAKYESEGEYKKNESWKDIEWIDGQYKVNHKDTYKYCTLIADVTKADVWITDYSKEYQYKTSTSEPEEHNLQIPDTEYEQEEGSPKTSSDGSDLPGYQHFKDKLDKLSIDTHEAAVAGGSVASYGITSCTADYYSRNINSKENGSTNTEKQEYIGQPAVNNPKVKKKTKEDYINNTGQDNFVTILCDPRHIGAKEKITGETKSWLMEIIESNEDTVDMVSLTEYLLYKVTADGEDDTDLELNLEVDPIFSEGYRGAGVYGGTLQEKVWFSLKDLGYSDIAIAGAMGNIHYESGGFSASTVEKGTGNGIGMCQWSFEGRTRLEEYAASKGVPWSDEDTQVEFLVAILSGQGKAAEYAYKRTSGYLTPRPDTRSTKDDWSNATTIADSTLHFMRFFESPTYKDGMNSLDRRTEYAQMYYDQFRGQSKPINYEIGETIPLTGENKIKMERLINEALRIARDDRYQYSQSARDSEFYYDCSSLVSRLYQDVFGIIPRLDAVGNGPRATDNINYICNKKYTLVSMNNLQPGDILWKSGHVALYIGSGNIVEAKGVKEGIIDSITYPYASKVSSFTEAYRIIK